VCVCSLGYPSCNAHALYCIVICGLSSCTQFSHSISLTTLFLGGKKCYCIRKVWVLIFSRNPSEIFLILERIKGDAINVHRSSCKVPTIFVILCSELNLVYRFSKFFPPPKKISNYMQIRQVGAVLFQAEGRTNRKRGLTKLIVAFRNFC